MMTDNPHRPPRPDTEHSQFDRLNLIAAGAGAALAALALLYYVATGAGTTTILTFTTLLVIMLIALASFLRLHRDPTARPTGTTVHLLFGLLAVLQAATIITAIVVHDTWPAVIAAVLLLAIGAAWYSASKIIRP